MTARGIRNNNPGNLVHSGDQWQGMSADQTDPRFVQFDTPEAGLRAMARNLEGYQVNKGINTLAEIFQTYAPKNENNTEAYIKRVSKELGVAPDEQVNLSDPAFMGRLMTSIIGVENDGNPYTPDQIMAGVNAGLRGINGPLPASSGAPARPAAAPPSSFTPPGADPMLREALRDTSNVPLDPMLASVLNDKRGQIPVENLPDPSAPPPGPSLPGFSTEDLAALSTGVTGALSPTAFRANAPLTRQEVTAIDRKLAEEEAKYKDQYAKGALAAIEEENSMAYLFGENTKYLPDPEFKPDAAYVQEWLKDLPEHLHEAALEEFGTAVSAAHADALKARMLHSMENEKYIDGMGVVPAFGARMGAMLADPLAWGAMAVTGGLATPVVGAMKLGRIGKIAVSALEGAAGVAMPQSVLAAYKPTLDAGDVLRNSMMGLVLGAAGGAIFGKGSAAGLEHDLARSARSAADVIEERAAAGLDPVPPPPSMADFIGPPTADQVPDLVAAGPGKGLDSVGAARVDRLSDAIDMNSEDMRIILENSPKSAFGGLRIDAAGVAMSSPIGAVRDLASRLMHDGVGYANKAHVVEFSGAEKKLLLESSMATKFKKAVEGEFHTWAAENGISRNAANYDELLDQFMEQVTLASIAGKAGREAFPQHVLNAADAGRGLYMKFRQYGADPTAMFGASFRSVAVKGMDKIDEAFEYGVPRIKSNVKIARLIEEFGAENIAKVYAVAFKRANPEVSDEIAEAVGKQYLQTQRLSAVGGVVNKFDPTVSEGQALLRSLEAEGGAIHGPLREEVIDFLKKFEERSNGGASVAHAKRRTLMDWNTTIPLKARDGSYVRDVHFMEAFETNYKTLFTAYNRKMSGAVALGHAGIGNRAAFDAELQTIKEIAASRPPGYSEARLNKDLTLLEYAYSAIAGEPFLLNKAGIDVNQMPLWKAAKLIRDFNYFRALGTTGMFAQTAEIPLLLTRFNLGAVMDGVPGFKSMLRNVKTGKFSDELTDAIDSEIGIGTQRFLGDHIDRLDDVGSIIDPLEGEMWAKAEKVMHKAKKLTSDMSLLAPMTVWMQKWAARAAVNHYIDVALGRAKESLGRMSAEGIDDGLLAGIKAEVEKGNVGFKKGLTGEKVTSVEWAKWDIDTRARFQLALQRIARRTVQEVDVGSLPVFLATNPLAKLIFQFRNFMVTAYSKQLLHGLHVRDWRTFMQFSTATFGASLVYMARVNAMSVGMAAEQRKDFLDRAMAPERVAFGAFNLSSWSSLFPTAIQTVEGAIPGRREMISTRSSQLPSGFIAGNPTFAMFDGLLTGTAGAIANGFDQQAYRKLVMPWLPNAIGVVNVHNAIMSGLPRDLSKSTLNKY